MRTRYVSLLMLPQYRALTPRGVFALLGLATGNDYRYIKIIEFQSEDDLRDWIFGWYPIEYRTVRHAGDLRHIDERHIEWRRLENGESPRKYPKRILRQDDEGFLVAAKAADPEKYDGLRHGDVFSVFVRNTDQELISVVEKRAAKVGAFFYPVGDTLFDTDGYSIDPELFRENADLMRLWFWGILKYDRENQWGDHGDDPPQNHGYSSR